MTEAPENNQIVQVAYAEDNSDGLMNYKVVDVRHRARMTAEQAIEASGLLQQFPHIDLAKNKIGVYGEVVRLSYQVVVGDRVEIYRDLLIDPKQARRIRAKKAS